jgi:two-component system chemotaxis family response regulator WspR
MNGNLRILLLDDSLTARMKVKELLDDNGTVAVDVMKGGAQDYLVKGEITRQNLHRAIRNAIEKVAAQLEQAAKTDRIERLTKELAEANSQLALLSRLAPLTKLSNRRVLEESTTQEHERSVRCTHTYCIIMLDIDHFKRFNDTQGHQAGYECLRRVARRISDSTRVIDIDGRYGGEEFIVLTPETPLEGVQLPAERIRAEVHALGVPHLAVTSAEAVTVSIGVAQDPAERCEETIKNADEALYAAKRNGRNPVCNHEAESHGVVDHAECEVSS